MRLLRRQVLAAACGSTGWPTGLRAQSTGKLRRIGVVALPRTADLAGPEPRSSTAAAFVRGMHEMGYVYGKHYITLPHGLDGQPERLPVMTAELLREQPDVIVVTGAAVAAFKAATATVPIVMSASLDPVGEGLIRSLVKPGGNVTGLSLQTVETTGKRLELLKELVPAGLPVGAIWNDSSRLSFEAAQATARERGWMLHSLEIREPAQWEASIEAAVRARVGSLLVLAAAVLFPRAKRLTELVAQARLPAVYELRPYAEAGGLMSYGADIVDIWRRASVYVDKLLNGAKPAELPVEQPTRFELVLNMRAAKAMGLAIPQSFLLRADEVIS